MTRPPNFVVRLLRLYSRPPRISVADGVGKEIRRMHRERMRVGARLQDASMGQRA
jgi:hypothetical protein